MSVLPIEQFSPPPSIMAHHTAVVEVRIEVILFLGMTLTSAALTMMIMHIIMRRACQAAQQAWEGDTESVPIQRDVMPFKIRVK